MTYFVLYHFHRGCDWACLSTQHDSNQRIQIQIKKKPIIVFLVSQVTRKGMLCFFSFHYEGGPFFAFGPNEEGSLTREQERRERGCTWRERKSKDMRERRFFEEEGSRERRRKETIYDNPNAASR